ncbi:hypothetical protein D4764_09G0009340 [Takifugu flavidus]|uniref:Uncharacterized protein n=1 Tax=Takifugu flavidus TaxID=433684 RepID=A0A5C6ML08_9TELE|nr:hypothetical protein D4764_09G0009340 [Takifugu flavidus]
MGPSAARMNGAVVLFVEKVEQVDRLVEAGISVVEAKSAQSGSGERPGVAEPRVTEPRATVDQFVIGAEGPGADGVTAPIMLFREGVLITAQFDHFSAAFMNVYAPNSGAERKIFYGRGGTEPDPTDAFPDLQLSPGSEEFSGPLLNVCYKSKPQHTSADNELAGAASRLSRVSPVDRPSQTPVRAAHPAIFVSAEPSHMS